MNQPIDPKKQTENPASPVNPDPKAHPIHPAIPEQPIHEGTGEGSDPVQPITESEDLRTR